MFNKDHSPLLLMQNQLPGKLTRKKIYLFLLNILEDLFAALGKDNIHSVYTNNFIVSHG
jgi:hypothetical protein